MTRALWLSLHGDFVAAYAYNWRIAIIVPIFVGYWLKEMIRVVKRLKE